MLAIGYDELKIKLVNYANGNKNSQIISAFDKIPQLQKNLRNASLYMMALKSIR